MSDHNTALKVEYQWFSPDSYEFEIGYMGEYTEAYQYFSQLLFLSILSGGEI